MARPGRASLRWFKTTADPYVGKLTYLRTGLDQQFQVECNEGQDERIGQLFMARQGSEPVANVVAGDIGAVAKLNTTGTEIR